MPRRKQNPQSLKQTVSTAIKKIVWRVAIYIRLSKGRWQRRKLQRQEPEGTPERHIRTAHA